jgi:hypothetical protein
MASYVPKLYKWIEEHEVIHALVRQHMLRALKRMKF